MAAYETAGKSDDWHTPAYIFDELGTTFDLDVSAPPEGPRYAPAHNWFFSDALSAQWYGFVWMNPPFGHQRHKLQWLQRFFDHGNGIALVPDRTSAPWFQEYAPMADAMMFIAPKVKFERDDGSLGKSPGTGTVLLASGSRAVAALHSARCLGIVLINSRER